MTLPEYVEYLKGLESEPTVRMMMMAYLGIKPKETKKRGDLGDLLGTFGSTIRG